MAGEQERYESGPEDGAPEPPPDPTTALVEVAVTMHVMFLAYKTAGFTDYQACVILGTFMAVSGSGAQGETPP